MSGESIDAISRGRRAERHSRERGSSSLLAGGGETGSAPDPGRQLRPWKWCGRLVPVGSALPLWVRTRTAGRDSLGRSPPACGSTDFLLLTRGVQLLLVLLTILFTCKLTNLLCSCCVFWGKLSVGSHHVQARNQGNLPNMSKGLLHNYFREKEH